MVCAGSPASRVSRSRSATAARLAGSSAGAGIDVELLCERGVLVAQRLEPRLELGEPGLQPAGVEVAVLESLVVAVERAVAAADLLGDRMSLFF